MYTVHIYTSHIRVALQDLLCIHICAYIICSRGQSHVYVEYNFLNAIASTSVSSPKGLVYPDKS